MRGIVLALGLGAALLGAAPALTQRPLTQQPAAPAPRDWTTLPVTPGRWTYSGGAAPSASYAGFGIRCPAHGRIVLTRAGANGALTFRTTSTSRAVPAGEIAATDPLLDALAFSRGKFAVEAVGAPTLTVPAWPELARVVEECRR